MVSHDSAADAIHAVAKVLDSDANRGEWAALLTWIYAEVGQAAGAAVIAEINAYLPDQAKIEAKGFELDEADYDPWTNDTIDWLQTFAASKVEGITEYSRQQIKDVLSSAAAEGLGIDAAADGIDALYDNWEDWRSELIARTEIIGASNAAGRFAAMGTGLNLDHYWIATDDAHTRPSHAEADGQQVPADEPYQVGGSELMFPGDPDGDPGEVANCRCTEGWLPLDYI